MNIKQWILNNRKVSNPNELAKSFDSDEDANKWLSNLAKSIEDEKTKKEYDEDHLDAKEYYTKDKQREITRIKEILNNKLIRYEETNRIEYKLPDEYGFRFPLKENILRELYIKYEPYTHRGYQVNFVFGYRGYFLFRRVELDYSPDNTPGLYIKYIPDSYFELSWERALNAQMKRMKVKDYMNKFDWIPEGAEK